MVRLAPMFMKILLTATVIAGAILVLRMRKRPQRVAVPVISARPPSTSQLSIPKLAAYTLLFIMLVGSGYFVFRQWEESWRVVTVYVVNSDTGREVSYQAYKGEVGERSFKTTDGRLINLAPVERMELGRR